MGSGRHTASWCRSRESPTRNFAEDTNAFAPKLKLSRALQAVFSLVTNSIGIFDSPNLASAPQENSGVVSSCEAIVHEE